MKNNDYSGCSLVVYAIIAVIVIALGIWFTIAIINSDLPDWMKFILLR